jgi:hypothetical protein
MADVKKVRRLGSVINHHSGRGCAEVILSERGGLSRKNARRAINCPPGASSLCKHCRAGQMTGLAASPKSPGPACFFTSTNIYSFPTSSPEPTNPYSFPTSSRDRTTAEPLVRRPAPEGPRANQRLAVADSRRDVGNQDGWLSLPDGLLYFRKFFSQLG